MKLRFSIRSVRHPGGDSRRQHSQRGFFLLMLMFAVAMMAIALVALSADLAAQIKRDKEDELIHRGTQYARAIKKFYRKNHRYPARIEDLEDTNSVRYLRRRYKDPMTPDGKWKILTQADVAAAIANPNFGVGGGLAPVSDSGLNSSASSSASPTPSPTPTPGSFGSGPNTFGGLQGNPIGGGGIWGVVSTSTKKGLHEFGGKANYNKWLFIYSVNQDVQQVGGGIPRLLKGPYNPQAFTAGNNNLNNPQNPGAGGPNRLTPSPMSPNSNPMNPVQ